MKCRKSKLAITIIAMATGWLTYLAANIVAFGKVTSRNKADVAIVLGAAVHGNRPSPVFEERLNHAIALYQQGQVRNLILTGGVGKNTNIAESVAAKSYALAQSIPPNVIEIETTSHTTRQNLMAARSIMTAHNLHTALIVSDPLHMKRAMLMTNDLGMLAQPSPTPTTKYQSIRATLPFLLRELYFYHHYLVFTE